MPWWMKCFPVSVWENKSTAEPPEIFGQAFYKRLAGFLGAEPLKKIKRSQKRARKRAKRIFPCGELPSLKRTACHPRSDRGEEINIKYMDTRARKRAKRIFLCGELPSSKRTAPSPRSDRGEGIRTNTYRILYLNYNYLWLSINQYQYIPT